MKTANQLRKELKAARQHASMLSLRHNIGRASYDDVRQARQDAKAIERKYILACDGDREEA